MPMHAFCSPQKGSRFTWVGLLAWRGQYLTVCRFTFPSNTLSGVLKRRALTHSGGTAPDLHRTSLLCPSWAPEALKVISRFVVAQHAGGSPPPARREERVGA